MTTTTTTALERVTDDVFSDIELRTLAGFLGGYSGLTREAYALDLRQFAQWCQDRAITLFAVARGGIEGFARNLDDRGRARATISRRLCTITCLYKYAVEEGLLDRSPAVHVRRPRLDYESNATGLDRNEVGAMLVAAGLAGAREHALISLLALMGCECPKRSAPTSSSSASNAVTGRWSCTARAARPSRSRSPHAPRGPSILLSGNAVPGRSCATATATAWIGTGPQGSCDVSPEGPGSSSGSGQTRCGTRSSLPPSTPASLSAMSKKPPVTPTRAPPCVTTGPECRSTGTPPTSCPPSSPAPADSQKCSLRARHNERGAGNLGACAARDGWS